MGITRLSKVIFDFVRKGDMSAREVATLTSRFCTRNGRYREVLSADMLPKYLRSKLSELGVSNPTLVTGYNSRVGSVVAGVAVKDGKKTVGHIAVGFDKTKGSSPILQLRGKLFDDKKSELAKLQMTMNPNSPIDDTVDFATSMSKRNGNLTLHSEIGNAHYYDLTVNPEQLRNSAFNSAFPGLDNSENQLKKFYKSFQQANYIPNIKRAGKKFSELFSQEQKQQKVSAKAHLRETFAKKDIPANPGKIQLDKSDLECSKFATKIVGTKSLVKTIKAKPLKLHKVDKLRVSKNVSAQIDELTKKVSTIGPKRVQVSKNRAHYGKHKIKRYLYHMTSEENYKKMLETGRIQLSSDRTLDYGGVFMTELENLAKRWRVSKDWNIVMPENKDGVFLSMALIQQVAKDSKRVVCLRIPTKYLDHNALKVRSQNKLIGSEATNKYKSHVAQGAPAKDANLFKQRKEAIEYIYQDEIPMSQVELAGIADVPQLSEASFKTWSAARQKDTTKNFFLNLFKGQPEAKGIEAMM